MFRFVLKFLVSSAVLAGPAVVVAGFVANAQTATVLTADGSSTVYPLTKAMAELYSKQARPQAELRVTFSGTGGGFKKFCSGETNINNASRPIISVEMEACRKSGVVYAELPVAYDALTIVVHPANTWAKDITTAELKKLWQANAQSRIVRWSQVRAGWPDRPIKLFGPGKESGTFDYFQEAVLGKGTQARADYTASEDDDELVAGVAADPNALGYFGFAYYQKSNGKLKALAVDSGTGPTLPSPDSVVNNKYQPLSRPLFIYVNSKAAQANPELRRFVEFYLSNVEEQVVAAGYIPLPHRGYQIVSGNFFKGKSGTVFGGRPSVNLTFQELLSREASQ